jgi:hypothetical protein
MKQVNSDFSESKVGDPVYSLIYGEGIIEAINEDKFFPLICRFKDNTECYRMIGAGYVEGMPMIFTHPVKIIHADDMPVNPRIAEIEKEIQRFKNELEALKEVNYEK